MTAPPARGRIPALLRQRCPRCRTGPIFDGWIRSPSECSVCGLRFAREPGYWVGAMYLSYAMAVPILAGLTGIVRLARPAWSWSAVIATAALLAVPLAPVLYRYARTIWVHFDRLVDPE